MAAASTNKNLYGQDYYKRIGALGGKASGTGGFYANRDLARKVGRIGGAVSRKGEANKLNKRQAAAARKRVLAELSELQTTKLSDKYGTRRPW